MNEEKNVYSKPEIIFEIDLETKAGSSIGCPDNDNSILGLPPDC